MGDVEPGEGDPLVQALGLPHLWKICPAPFFKVHLPDGDIIEGTLCQKKIFLM